MANKVQIVIEVDESRGTAAVGKIKSAISDMGTKVRVVGREGTRSMQTFTNQGLLQAVLGANLLERAVTSMASRLKDATFGSTLLAARSDVLDTVMGQLAKTTGNSARVMRAQQRQMEALGIDTIRAQEALVKFTTAELSTADAVKIANVAHNRAQISGETTSATTERFTRAIMAQEVELLKLANIVVRQDDAFKRYAVTLGKSAKDLNEVERRQAFVNEILRQARNDTGLYESAWAKAGKRLLSIPRLARQAGIALGRNFQDELALGVDATLRFLKVAEENAATIAIVAKEVVILTAAYVALRIAMSETILVNVAAFFSGMLPSIGRVTSGLETMRLLMMGAGGKVGAAGAYGLLAAAAVAAGFAIGEMGDFLVTQSIMADAATFDIEKWRAALKAVGIETKNAAEAEVILARVGHANRQLIERKLPVLRVNANLLDELRQAEDRLRVSGEANTRALEERAKALDKLSKSLDNRAFEISLTNLDRVAKERAKGQREIEQLLAQVRKFPELQAQAQAVAEQIIIDTQARLAKQLADGRDKAARVLLEAIGRQLEGVDQINAKRDEELAKFQEIVRQFPALRQLAARAEVAVTEEASREILELREEELKKMLDLRRKVSDQVAALERDAAFAGPDRFEQIELERAERLRDIEGNINASAEQLARARVAINASASADIRQENERIADEQMRNFERQAREHDRLLDRMVRFTEQTGSILGNIWKTLEQEFKRSVTKMVLSFLLGMRTIQGGARGAAGGGILATLLGLGGFGGTAVGAQPGATPPFVGANFVNQAFGGGTIPGLSGPGLTGSGAAGQIPGATPTAAPGSGGGPLGGLLGRGGLLGGGGQQGGGGLAVLLGLMLGNGRSSPLRAGLGAAGGVLGGVALSGALSGIAGGVGPLAGLGVGLAGFLTNPIGLALLGGIAGFSVIRSILSRGGKKRDATAIANTGFGEIDQVVQAFRLRQTDYLRAIDQMTTVWERMVAGWNQIGGSVGRNSISDQQRFFDARVRELNDIQAERNRREQRIGTLPVPSFDMGGLVHGLGSRPILAAVHPGEFVVKRGAVERVGVPKLKALNEGGGGETFTVYIDAIDGPSVKRFLDDNEDALRRKITKVIRRDKTDGGPIGRLM